MLLHDAVLIFIWKTNAFNKISKLKMPAKFSNLALKHPSMCQHRLKYVCKNYHTHIHRVYVAVIMHIIHQQNTKGYARLKM